MIFNKEVNFNKQNKHLYNTINLIPGSSQTISKFPARFPIGAYPLFIHKANGNNIYDIDGNEFLDWTSGLGSNILGGTNKTVNKAIKNQLEYGINYSLNSELEYTLAEKITNLIPNDRCKIFKTGSDSCNAAIRVARAYTGKQKIIVSKSCYHGTGDWFACSMDYHWGVPDYNSQGLLFFEYNNIDSVKTLLDKNDDIASIILEPAITDNPHIEFLFELQELCNERNIIVIYDEMVTGMRSPNYSIQNDIGTSPDLSCFGKSIGNGMPISVLLGERDIMSSFDVDNGEPPVFYSGTFSGECLSIASAIATIDELKRIDDSYYPSRIGKTFMEGYSNYIFNSTNYYRIPSTLSLKGNTYKSVFMQQLAKRHIVCGNIVYPNYAHTMKDVKTTIDAIEEVANELYGMTDTDLYEMLDCGTCRDFLLRKT